MTGRDQLTADEVGEPRDLPLGIGSRPPLHAALAYGAAGWPVLPVAGASAGECACKRSCESPGKHPITRHGLHDATTDPVLIGEWSMTRIGRADPTVQRRKERESDVHPAG